MSLISIQPRPARNFLGSGGTTCEFLRDIYPDGVPETFQLAEVGVWKGDTSMEFAKILNNSGKLYLFDYEQFVSAATSRLLASGFTNIEGHSNSDKSLDSYNWSLMKLLHRHETPIFDYVYLDGSHCWAIDGLAFFLVDRLLKPGGFIDFDDYDWTYATSPGANPLVRPSTAVMFTSEQIGTPQVKLIVDLLVRRSGRYVEVAQNKIFMKLL